MTRLSRRTLLSSTAGLLALSAGCIADGTEESPDEDDDADTDDDPGSDDDGAEDLPDGVTGYETQGYQYSMESETTTVDLVRDADDATEWLETRALSDTDPLDGFVDDTDFETSILVSLESDAPNPCYELALESIDVRPIEDGGTDEGSETDGDDGSSDGSTDSGGESDSGGTDGSDDEELVLEATVRDTADETEACTPVITTVGRLVRVTFESEPLTALTATVVDHEGNTSGASMRSDSASASESRSVEAGDGSGEGSDDGS